MQKSLSPLVRIITCRWICSHFMALLEMRILHVAACCWGWLHTLSGTLFQLRNIKCFTLSLRLVQVHCFKSGTLHAAVCYWGWHHTLSGTQFQIRKKCMLQLLGIAPYTVRFAVSTLDTLIHFQVMLSLRKHSRSGITEKKKSAGQGGQHHHNWEKEFDKETYGIYVGHAESHEQQVYLHANWNSRRRRVRW
jgi:hypothetical protein